METKKRNTLIVLILILILGVALAKFGELGTFSAGVTSEDFVKPSWARIECEKSDAENHVQGTTPLTGGSIYCGQPENTDQCRLNIRINSANIKGITRYITDSFYKFKIYGRVCNLDGSGCESELVIAQISSAKFDVWFTPQRAVLTAGKKWFIRARAEGTFGYGSFNMPVLYVKYYNRWDLVRHVGGGKWIVRSGSCYVAGRDDEGVNLNSKILQTESYPNPLLMTGAAGSKWINYVDDWFYGPGTNVFRHPSYGEVYCTAGQIFKIIKLQFKDGSLKKLDPTYNSATPDGRRVLNGLGSRLAGVECCPNEPNCGDDFKYKPTPQPKECFSDIQCYNTGNPVAMSPTTYVKHTCSPEGKCVQSQIFTTECTSDSICISKYGAGYVCDMSLVNYGKCRLQQVGPYCGDGVCDPRTETKETCPDDCGPPPSKDVCMDECDEIKTGILHPTGSMAKQVCKVKCGIIGFWEKYKIMIFVIIIALLVIGGALVFKKYYKK